MWMWRQCIFLVDVFKLIAEVGAPIAGALVMLWFLFIIMKQKIEDTVNKVKMLETFAKSLTTRVKTINNDVIKLDTAVSAALGLKPDLDRIARAENFVEDGTIDVRRDQMDNVAQLIAEFGFPIVMMVSLGYFVYYIWNAIQTVINPAVGSQHMALIKLIDQVRMLDNDIIRLQEKIDTVLQIKENEILNRSDESTTSESSSSR